MIMMQQIQVLLIDDDIDFLTKLGKCLSYAGIKSESYADPLDGLKAYKDGVFDIVSTDLSMPKMNGMQLIRALKQYDPSVKILVVTGNYDDDVRCNALSLGALSVLTKPLDLGSFIRTIAGNMDRPGSDWKDGQPGGISEGQ